jgi:hypothetical protein
MWMVLLTTREHHEDIGKVLRQLVGIVPWLLPQKVEIPASDNDIPRLTWMNILIKEQAL